MREIIYFKQTVYVQALTELVPRAFPEGPPPHPAWWAEVTSSGLNPAHSATAPID